MLLAASAWSIGLKRDRQILGVGSVGKEPGKATYTLYSPYTNAVSFRTVRYGTQGKGFGKT